MRRGWALHILGVLAILAIQLAAVVHATQHELSALQTVHCDLCAAANAAPMPPAEFVVSAPPCHARAEPAPGTTEHGARMPFAPPKPRAPPRLSA